MQRDKLTPLLKLWESWRGDTVLPNRKCIDPVEIPATLMPCVALIDVIDAHSFNFRIRLAGDAIRRVHDFPLRGRTFKELERPDRLSITFADYLRCVVDAKPIKGRGTLVYRNRDLVQFDRLLLPFVNDGMQVVVILASFDYDQEV